MEASAWLWTTFSRNSRPPEGKAGGKQAERKVWNELDEMALPLVTGVKDGCQLFSTSAADTHTHTKNNRLTGWLTRLERDTELCVCVCVCPCQCVQLSVTECHCPLSVSPLCCKSLFATIPSSSSLCLPLIRGSCMLSLAMSRSLCSPPHSFSLFYSRCSFFDLFHT